MAIVIVGADAEGLGWEAATSISEQLVNRGQANDIFRANWYPARLLIQLRYVVFVFTENTLGQSETTLPACSRPDFLKRWNRVLFTQLDEQPLAGQMVCGLCLGAPTDVAAGVARTTLATLRYFGAQELLPLEYGVKKRNAAGSPRLSLARWQRCFSSLFFGELMGAAE